MNREESRLRTFRNWPTNAPVDARRIAKAGFYYMGQNLEVQCFKCGGRISEWNYNDQVMARHRALDPRCPFVRSPALSGNVPITNNGNEMQISSNPEENSNLTTMRISEIPSPAAVNVQEDQMHDEQLRLSTFSNWPVSFIVTPESLAKAGFYYVQQGDKVRCAYCSVIIGRWERGDDPLEEHRRHSEGCSFILALGRSVPDTSGSGITLRQGAGDCSESTMKSLGVQSHRVAKHPKYSSKDSRLATFTTWPGDVTQSPDELAEAGFYYAGSDDQVRCFHCNGGLRKWDPSDDPWVEHARWYPDCGFLLLIKGERFINDCLTQHPPIMLEEATRTRPSNMSQCRLLPVSEEELEGLMSGPAATAALQIGLDLSRVKAALRQRMERTGQPFMSPDDLIEATLDIQLDEGPYQDAEETWSTPLHSPVHRRLVERQLPRTREQRISSRDTSDSEESESHLQKGLAPVPGKPPPPSVSVPDINAVGTDRKVTLEEENRRLREARLCKICMDVEVCIVFLPCGHLVTCVDCAHSLADCPVCRRTIKATVRTFLS